MKESDVRRTGAVFCLVSEPRGVLRMFASSRAIAATAAASSVAGAAGAAGEPLCSRYTVMGDTMTSSTSCSADMALELKGCCELVLCLPCQSEAGGDPRAVRLPAPGAHRPSCCLTWPAGPRAEKLPVLVVKRCSAPACGGCAAGCCSLPTERLGVAV